MTIISTAFEMSVAFSLRCGKMTTHFNLRGIIAGLLPIAVVSLRDNGIVVAEGNSLITVYQRVIYVSANGQKIARGYRAEKKNSRKQLYKRHRAATIIPRQTSGRAGPVSSGELCYVPLTGVLAAVCTLTRSPTQIHCVELAVSIRQLWGRGCSSHFEPLSSAGDPQTNKFAEGFRASRPGAKPKSRNLG